MNDVAGYIQRKTMLYQTGVEYGDYTMLLSRLQISMLCFHDEETLWTDKVL